LAYVVVLHGKRILDGVPPNVWPVVVIFLIVSGLVFLCGLPVFSGFCAAFFWRQPTQSDGNESNAGLWSVVTAWLPAPLYLGISSLVPLLFWIDLFVPFLVFTMLYVAGLSQGREFWNSNRARQWLGDFSDLS
jgi:hypothetical protein